MMALREWWDARELREQRLLMVLAAIVAAMLLWLLAEGLAGISESSEQRFAAKSAELAAVRSAAGELDRANAAAPRLPAGQSVRDIVTASAAAQGLEFSATTPEPENGIRVTITSVRPTFLFGWLAALDRDSGVVAGSVSIQRNDDATVTADVAFPGAPA